MRPSAFQQGDVLFVDVVYSGSVGSKRRPVVVLSTDAFHGAGCKIVVAGITTNVLGPFRPGDVLLEDWHQAGLVRPSAFRGLILTVDRNKIIRELGQLSEADFKKIKQGVADIMGFTVP